MTATLDGRTALVTGASRGIGRAIAVALSGAGARVALLARHHDDLDKLVAELGGPAKAVAIPCDVTSATQVGIAVNVAITMLGHLDIVVNNAGGCRFMAPFRDTRLSGWDSSIRLNLDSVVNVCHAVADHLIARGRGSVINVSSTVAAAGLPRAAHYAAAKSAVISLTRTLAIEWAGYGIRVNALCPGWIATELSSPQRDNPQAEKELLAQVPMGRWGLADELAAPAVFLASDASSFMTGQSLVIDGGLSA
ncbi:MAG TPA: SDR family NAD(P)-dependent oxidoreductase [Amycolatopsis sp.]|nr:SDR family NAD(P)-dependent oxidoreductase [Amycolatopsis sp.]